MRKARQKIQKQTKRWKTQRCRKWEIEILLRNICSDCLCRWLPCPADVQRCIRVVPLSTWLDTPGRYLPQNFPIDQRSIQIKEIDSFNTKLKDESVKTILKLKWLLRSTFPNSVYRYWFCEKRFVLKIYRNCKLNFSCIEWVLARQFAHIW